MGMLESLIASVERSLRKADGKLRWDEVSRRFVSAGFGQGMRRGLFGMGRKHAASAGRPQRSAPARKQQEDEGILGNVDKQIYGMDANTDDLASYRRYIEVRRETDIRTIARERRCTMYQVIQDIQDFQNIGYFRGVRIDEENYKLVYQAPAGAARQAAKAAGGTRRAPGARAGQGRRQEIGPTGIGTTLHTHGGTGRVEASPYMTMPADYPIGYMTMTEDYRISYMTVPEDYSPGYMTMPGQ